MSDLSAEAFDEYFQAVHGHEPFPWQSRLTREVLASGKWPDVIELPTGTGKTAVLDTALFTMAARPEVFPRRVVFVIDRRIVVDQVFKRAELIAEKISGARNDGVLAELRRRLSDFTDADELLGVVALRGGVPIEHEWARRPEQPWVMVSTVDQFGSRLLFRGYGVSERMRPVYAGLAGNDCLVILDEVHLSRAFAQTLRDISSDGAIPSICSVRPNKLPRRFQVVEMSATANEEGAKRFELVHDDFEASESLKRIADAPKRATLVEVRGTSPAHEAIPKAVLALVLKGLRDEEKSVGVIVNRVPTARETCAALRKQGIRAHLVTGRMRPIDRESVMDRIKQCVDPDRSERLEERTVVVATQAIEVGADFSFDALISEVAPIDALRQRLGRLDRRGSLAWQSGNPARCWILGVASALKPNRPDPIYGDASRVTWEALQANSSSDEIDVGPSTDLLKRLGDDARSPKEDAPLLLPTHVEAWTQTCPKPVADPSIADFLHGKGSQHEPDVSVMWRWDRSSQALALVPPRPAEFLSVPVSAVRRWIRGLAEPPLADTATTPPEEQRSRDQGVVERERNRLSRLSIWTGEEGSLVRPVERVDQISPGDRILADPSLGGITAGVWDPTSQLEDGTGDDASRSPNDLGDQAQIAYEKRATLRLDPNVREPWMESEPPKPDDERNASVTVREAVDQWLSDLPSDRLPKWVSKAVERFTSQGRFEVELVEHDVGDNYPDYYVIVECSVDPAVLGDVDDSSSSTGSATRLRDHLVGVGERAEAFGRRLGLSQAVLDDLRLAGELHDLGKIDRRFQAQLHGHDEVRIAETTQSGDWLAKSLPRARTKPRQWPSVRHEIGSVALVQSNATLLREAHDPDLVLHLIGTHHGFSRPLPQIKADDDPQQLEAMGRLENGGFRLCSATEDEDGTDSGSGERLPMSASTALINTPLALEMADRFWRLQHRYGHHGLAWLEAILRLADHQQSAEEAKETS